MILSTNNSLIKRYAKLKDKKYRDEERIKRTKEVREDLVGGNNHEES